MGVDVLGGVWLDPGALVALGVVLFALIGYAHDWGIEPGQTAETPSRLDTLVWCDQVASALEMVVATYRDAGIGGRTARGSAVRLRRSGGAARAAGATPPPSRRVGRNDRQSLAAHAQQHLRVTRVRRGSEGSEPLRGPAVLAAPARTRSRAASVTGGGVGVHGRVVAH